MIRIVRKNSKSRLLLFTVMSLFIAFFGMTKMSAYFKKDVNATIDYSTATYNSLILDLDKTIYPSAGNTATVELTINNINNYVISYDLSFSNTGLTYLIDGRAPTTYQVNANSSKTNTIVINGNIANDIIITINVRAPYSVTHTQTVEFDNIEPTVNNIEGGKILKATNQTLTLKCTDDRGIAAYYFGEVEPLSASDISTENSSHLESLTSESGLSKKIYAAGTYWFACKDEAGNFSKKSIEIYSYTVMNMFQNAEGTNAYTTGIYTKDSEKTYIAASGTILIPEDIYTIPYGSSSERYMGISVGVPSTEPASVVINSKTLSSNETYALWFARNLVYIKYKTGDGILTSTTHSSNGTYTWGVDSDGYITRNGTNNFTFYRYRAAGESLALDLFDYDNRNSMYIYKIGYVTTSGKEWICESGCSTANKAFSQAETTIPSTNSLCDARNSSCTIVVKVNWKKQDYGISYELNNGSVAAANPQTYNVDTATITLNNPTRVGYSFNGWTEKFKSFTWNYGFINLDNGGPETSTTYPNSYFTNLIRLKAGKTYTLSGFGEYNVNNIRWRVYNTNGIYIGNGSNNATYTPNSDCYVRIVFFETSTASQRNSTIISTSAGTTATIPKGSCQAINYVANWIANIYTITLDNQNATTAGTTTIYEKYNTGYYTNSGATTKMTTSANAITVPTRAGYTFGGYYTGTNGSGTQYINSSGYLTSSAAATNFTANGTLYANWSLIPIYVYYHANGGTPSSSSGYTTYRGFISPNGSSYEKQTIIGNTQLCSYTQYGLTKDNYHIISGEEWCTFDWSTCFNQATTYTYAELKSLSDNRDTYYELDLAAHWTQNIYTITLNNQSATTAGTTTIYEKYNTGYYTDSGATTKMSSNNGITVPTRTGYVFGGYYTGTNGSGTQYINSSGYLTSSASATNFTANGTLYAKWTLIPIYIYYHANGGTPSASSGYTTYKGFISPDGSSYERQIVRENTQLRSYTLYGLTKDSYHIISGEEWCTFDWSTCFNQATTYTYTELKNLSSNHDTYYELDLAAHWTQDIYTITLNNQSATTAGTARIYEKYNAGYYTNSGATTKMTTSANAITVPTKTGYTFGGYYTGTNGSGTQYINSSGYLTSSASATNFATDGTLYAKWTLIPVRIYYYANGGTVSSSSGYTTYNGWISPDGSSYETQTIRENAQIRNYTLYGLTKVNYHIASGEEWRIMNTTTTLNQATTYTYAELKALASDQGTYYEIDLTANWIGNVYTITLDNQSATTAGTTTIYEKYNTGYYTNSGATTKMTTSDNGITKPTKTGYTFGGYYTGTNGSGTQYINSSGYLTSSASTTNFTAAGTLYAKWTINKVYVVYNMNGGSWAGSTNEHLGTSGAFVTYDGASTSIFGVNYGETLNLANWNNPDYINIKRDGYLVVADKQWCTGTNGNGTCYNHDTYYESAGTDGTAATHFCDARAASCSVTLYVNWIIKPVRMYYHPNGGTLSSSSGYTIYNNWISQDGTSYLYHDLSSGTTNLYNFSTFELTRSGYKTVDGEEWCTAPDGSGTCFDEDINYTYEQYKSASSEQTNYYEVDLYAHWVQNIKWRYRVTCTCHGGGSSVSSTYRYSEYNFNTSDEAWWYCNNGGGGISLCRSWCSNIGGTGAESSQCLGMSNAG